MGLNADSTARRIIDRGSKNRANGHAGEAVRLCMTAIIKNLKRGACEPLVVRREHYRSRQSQLRKNVCVALDSALESPEQ